jgi:ribose 5-phosphate isomerase B
MHDTLFLGADHAGFRLKEYLISTLKNDYEVIDCGPKSYDKGDDYPNFAKLVCEKVIEHNGRGILICDTGIGMSIAANRYEAIRAALVTTDFMAERSRLHNNANILCLGQELASDNENENFVRIWLTTDFTNEERHIRRLQAIEELG